MEIWGIHILVWMWLGILGILSAASFFSAFKKDY
jgi:hypothetical protein